MNAAQPFDSEPGLSLFISGDTAYPSSLPLFTKSVGSTSGNIPLFLQQSTQSYTSSMNLFLQAKPLGTPSYTMPLSVLGSSGDNGFARYMPLYVGVGASGSDWSSQMNLYTTGFDR